MGTAQGACTFRGRCYQLVDLPGTYSLRAHSAEEEVARDFLCAGGADAAVVVCDATCLERSLSLVLQTLELEARTVVCVNLLDEAARRGIRVDLARLEEQLGVPVVGTAAGRGEGLEALLAAVEGVIDRPPRPGDPVRYPPAVEFALASLRPLVQRHVNDPRRARWAALRLLEEDGALLAALGDWAGEDPKLQSALEQARDGLVRAGLDRQALAAAVAAAQVGTAETLAAAAVTRTGDTDRWQRRLDRLLTQRSTGIPIMLLLLAGVFWLTLQGANYPSQLLSQALFWVQDALSALFRAAGAPEWLHGALVLGAYRTLAWVVSVMLPPMAIFFPLFTLLEDLGYLPRVAFVLDHAFQKARACGKQALTMCLGLGCNAAGVVGCRIIDSPRERMIAILTNNFMPCNGRFPTLIAVFTMFFVGTGGGVWQGLAAAAGLTGILLVGLGMTLLVSRLLSATLLRGTPSAFTLELPPYRRPRVGQVVVRSVLDRTLFVLGRAAAVAAPAGLLIWVCANLSVGGQSLLAWCTGFLDPFARLIGLDGVILMAFLLGFPANEIVIPILLMGYLSTGTLQDMESLDALRQLLCQNGWDGLTAVCTLLFSLMHWPCSTTCLTIAKESGGLRWALLGMAIPTGAGVTVCFLTASAARLLGLA